MDLKKRLINFLIAFLIVYILFGFILFFSQNSMIYYPDNQNFEDCAGFLDYEKISYNETRFYFRQGSENLMVHYHGNAGSACDRSFFREYFEQENNSIIFVEYAGYSNDSRKPSKELILQDVRNVHDYIKKGSFERVMVYGGSIGSGPASYHAFLGSVDYLIFVTPFSSLVDVAQSKYILYPVSILLRENYDNLGWLENFYGKVIIFHGSNDLVIPNRFSKKLFDGLVTEKKEYVLIEGYGHNNLYNSKNFQEKLSMFIKEAWD